MEYQQQIDAQDSAQGKPAYQQASERIAAIPAENFGPDAVARQEMGRVVGPSPSGANYGTQAVHAVVEVVPTDSAA